MTDVVLFMRSGWKNIRKQNIIWLFSALSLLSQIIQNTAISQETNLLWSCISLAEIGFLSFLGFVSSIGVQYLAYCFSISETVTITIQETLSAVRKFARKIIGFYILFYLLLSPFLCWVIFVSINKSTHSLQIANETFLAYSPISIFGPIWAFIIFGFFANDLSIWQSIKKSWMLFTNHFVVLIVLGLILTVILKTGFAASAALTALIQSGFDTASLDKVNFINPFTYFNKNVLFTLINGIFQMIFLPFCTSVFASAYLKYNENKVGSAKKARK
jgi:hypothetical protein